MQLGIACHKRLWHDNYMNSAEQTSLTCTTCGVSGDEVTAFNAKNRTSVDCCEALRLEVAADALIRAKNLKKALAAVAKVPFSARRDASMWSVS
jgi:hypothetical protein